MRSNKTAAVGHKMKTSFGSKLFDVFNVLLMCLLMLIILIPLIHVVSASFSNPSAYVRYEGLMWHPVEFCLDAYKAVAKNKNIFTGYMNTIFIVVVGTTINLISTLVAAYCLSRKNVMWKNIMMVAIVFSMYFSGGMIPFYLVVKSVGLNDSIWSLIIPTAVNTYNLIIMRTAMASVPESLENPQSWMVQITGQSCGRSWFRWLSQPSQLSACIMQLNTGTHGLMQCCLSAIRPIIRCS